MEKWKNRMKRVLFPNNILTFLMVIASVLLLLYSLGYQDAIPAIAYASYGFSAYTLTVVALKIPLLLRKIKKGLYENQYSSRYLTEADLRAKVSLYAGFAINAAYAVLKFVSGIYFHSLWLGAIAIYYMILSSIRFGLVKCEYAGMKWQDEKEQRKQDLNIYRRCGYLMFLLNIAVAALVVQMVWQNKSFTYPGLLIYATAAYTFYCFTMAIINLVKYRKLERPVMSAAKMISFACALMSMLGLQTALLTEFGADQPIFTRTMNSLTGGVVCIAIFMLAIKMIKRAGRELNRGRRSRYL